MERLIDRLRDIADEHLCIGDYNEFLRMYVIFTNDSDETSSVYKAVRRIVADGNRKVRVKRHPRDVEVWF